MNAAIGVDAILWRSRACAGIAVVKKFQIFLSFYGDLRYTLCVVRDFIPVSGSMLWCLTFFFARFIGGLLVTTKLMFLNPLIVLALSAMFAIKSSAAMRVDSEDLSDAVGLFDAIGIEGVDLHAIDHSAFYSRWIYSAIAGIDFPVAFPSVRVDMLALGNEEIEPGAIELFDAAWLDAGFAIAGNIVGTVERRVEFLPTSHPIFEMSGQEFLTFAEEWDDLYQIAGDAWVDRVLVFTGDLFGDVGVVEDAVVLAVHWKSHADGVTMDHVFMVPIGIYPPDEAVFVTPAVEPITITVCGVVIAVVGVGTAWAIHAISCNNSISACANTAMQLRISCIDDCVTNFSNGPTPLGEDYCNGRSFRDRCIQCCRERYSEQYYNCQQDCGEFVPLDRYYDVCNTESRVHDCDLQMPGDPLLPSESLINPLFYQRPLPVGEPSYNHPSLGGGLNWGEQPARCF